MIVPCGFCLAVIDGKYGKSLSVSCSGICNKRFHPACVDTTPTVTKYINTVPGLTWKCKDCERNCFSIDYAGLNTFLEDKHQELVDNLNIVFETLKSTVQPASRIHKS